MNLEGGLTGQILHFATLIQNDKELFIQCFAAPMKINVLVADKVKMSF